METRHIACGQEYALPYVSPNCSSLYRGKDGKYHSRFIDRDHRYDVQIVLSGENPDKLQVVGILDLRNLKAVASLELLVTSKGTAVENIEWVSGSSLIVRR